MSLLQSRSNLFGPCLPLGVLSLFDTFCSPWVADFIPIFQCTRSHVLFTSFTHQWRTGVIQACLYTSRDVHSGFITDVVAGFPYTRPLASPILGGVCQLIPAAEWSRGVRSGLQEYLDRPAWLQRDSPRSERAPLGTITHPSLTRRL